MRWSCRILIALALLLAAGARAAPGIEVRIEGIDAVLAANVRAHLGAVTTDMAEQPARLRRQVGRAVEAALQPHGYYDAAVTQSLAGGVLALRIDAGTRVLFATPELRIDGPAAADPRIAALLRQPPVAAGAPLRHEAYDDFRDALLGLCLRLGYFDARYRRHELQVDRASHRASARLWLDSGPRYRIGEISPRGTLLRPDLVRGLAPFRTGDAFDSEAVSRFEQRLRDTGHFSSVTVHADRAPPERADIVVDLEDALRSRYEVGAGFSTDSSLRLRFNRVTPLLNARGHSLHIESALSEPEQSLSAVYRMPHHDLLDDLFEVTAGLKNEHYEDTDSATATLGLHHVLRMFGDWSLNYGASAEFEGYSLGSETDKTTYYLQPGISLGHTQLDRGVDPQHGHTLFTALEMSDRAIGSNADFLRWRASGGWLHGFGNGAVTLLARADLGAILTDGFSTLPPSLRFQAGGDRSIRGYDYESIGPRDANGKVIGGRYLAVGSVEVSRRVRDRWRIAAFVDGGSAFDSRADDFYQSAGLGVRWLSPLGQLRVDLAFPVGDPEHRGVRLHISMGPPL